VARLVADGLSNKQIGARLFISERTVDSHVRGILNKLGFNSRTQIARWVASNR
jgi:DNA-binding NarL/FixJ family response regulator